MNKEKILLIGMGGHAKSIIDSLEANQYYEIVGFIENNKKGIGYKGYPILGTDAELETYYKKGIKKAFIAIGFMGKGTIREKIYDKLKEIGYQLPTIIDKTAIFSKNIEIGEGCFVGKGVILNSEVKIKKMAIINSGAIIEHECQIEAFSHIAVGSVLCGNCQIGEHTLIGANATVIQERKIGSHVIIGAGSVVIQDIDSNIIAYGNPCRKVRNNYE